MYPCCCAYKDIIGSMGKGGGGEFDTSVVHCETSLQVRQMTSCRCADFAGVMETYTHTSVG